MAARSKQVNREACVTGREPCTAGRPGHRHRVRGEWGLLPRSGACGRSREAQAELLRLCAMPSGLPRRAESQPGGEEKEDCVRAMT